MHARNKGHVVDPDRSEPTGTTGSGDSADFFPEYTYESGVIMRTKKKLNNKK